MKKVLILVLTILGMVSLGFAQDGTQAIPTAAANTTFYNVDGQQGHIQHGCMLCHAPHSANATAKTGNAYVVGGTMNPGNFDSSWQWSWGSGPVPPAIAGGNIAGSIYLWGNAITPLNYTTWDGSTINSGMITNGPGSAVVHTLLCMSCHDNANSGYLMGMGFGTNPANSTTELGVTNTVTDGFGDHIGVSQWGYNNTTGQGWDVNGPSSLSNSHPVHAVYSSGGYNWKINADGTFVDKSFQLTSSYSGHPAKLWMEGNTAYVECTSCHDPHRETQFAYWNGTNYTIGGANSTIFYLRGPYTDPTSGNGNTNANFCRSCHYSKSAAYAAANGASQ